MQSSYPLVFATTGGMGREVTVFYCLVYLLSRRANLLYSATVVWIIGRHCLFFAALGYSVHPWQPVLLILISRDASPEMGLAEHSRDYLCTV